MSDVDVAVLLARERYPTAKDRFEARVRPGAAGGAALRCARVDLVVLNDVRPTLGRRIVTTGQRVFCADPERDHAFIRDVQLRAADLDPFLRRVRRLKLEAIRWPAARHSIAICRSTTTCCSLSSPSARLAIDIAGELSARRGERSEDYPQVVRGLARDERFPAELVRELERSPGFRNILVHAYVGRDMDGVVEALERLEPVERSLEVVRRLEATSAGDG